MSIPGMGDVWMEVGGVLGCIQPRFRAVVVR